jgi:hypothetical protein
MARTSPGTAEDSFGRIFAPSYVTRKIKAAGL